MVEWIKEAGAALVANGGSDGYVQVADSLPFYTGAFAWLSDDNGLNQRVMITEVITSTNKLGVRFFPDNEISPTPPSYGRSDASDFTTANSARIDQEAQLVRVQPPYRNYPVR